MIMEEEWKETLQKQKNCTKEPVIMEVNQLVTISKAKIKKENNNTAQKVKKKKKNGLDKSIVRSIVIKASETLFPLVF